MRTGLVPLNVRRMQRQRGCVAWAGRAAWRGAQAGSAGWQAGQEWMSGRVGWHARWDGWPGGLAWSPGWDGGPGGFGVQGGQRAWTCGVKNVLE